MIRCIGIVSSNINMQYVYHYVAVVIVIVMEFNVCVCCSPPLAIYTMFFAENMYKMNCWRAAYMPSAHSQLRLMNTCSLTWFLVRRRPPLSLFLSPHISASLKFKYIFHIYVDIATDKWRRAISGVWPPRPFGAPARTSSSFPVEMRTSRCIQHVFRLLSVHMQCINCLYKLYGDHSTMAISGDVDDDDDGGGHTILCARVCSKSSQNSIRMYRRYGVSREVAHAPPSPPHWRVALSTTHAEKRNLAAIAIASGTVCGVCCRYNRRHWFLY